MNQAVQPQPVVEAAFSTPKQNIAIIDVQKAFSNMKPEAPMRDEQINLHELQSHIDKRMDEQQKVIESAIQDQGQKIDMAIQMLMMAFNMKK